MKKWICVLLIFAGCAHKRSLDYPLAESSSASKEFKPKSLGQVFKINLDDPQVALTDALDNCSKISCEKEDEKVLAVKLRSLHLSLRDKDQNQVMLLSMGLVEDFRGLMNTYRDQKEYIVPVMYQAWFLAGAMYPYSKAISHGLFDEVRKNRKLMDGQKIKPDNYYYLVALDTEYSNSKEIEKVQAYKKCMDLEPSSKRCQESYLRLTSNAPSTIKKAEKLSVVSATGDCQSEVKKEGISIYLASNSKAPKFPLSRPFMGKKFFYARKSFFSAPDIAKVYLDSDKKIKVRLSPGQETELAKAIQSHSGEMWILMRQDMIYASTPLSQVSENNSLHFLKVDLKGLSGLLSKCE